jgi:hypothetical protein
VRRDFLARYEAQAAGGATHLEYWIPVQDLDAIIGAIEVIAEFPEA